MNVWCRRLLLLSALAVLIPACGTGGGETGSGPFSAEVLYVSDHETPGLKELYAATLDGASRRKISDPVRGGVGVVVLSPDHHRVAYAAGGTLQLAAVDGGVPVEAPSGSAFVDLPVWSPDGSRVAYLASNRVLHTCTPTGGSDAVLYSPTQVDRFLWAPDSSRLAYQATNSSVYTALPDGTNPLMVIGVTTYGVLSLRWSPDSAFLSYEAALDAYSGYEVYVRPSGGGAAVRLSPVASVNSDSLLQGWSPDGARLAYDWFGTAVPASGLYTATSVGLISGPLSTTFSGQSAWSPDSSWIAWTSVKAGGALELVTSAPDGSSKVTLTGSTGTVSRFRNAPDGSAIAYAADAITPGRGELFTTPPRSAGSARISALQSGDDAFGDVISWSPGSTRVAYRIDSAARGVKELHSAAAMGGDALLTGRLMESFEWSSDGLKLGYLADEDTPGVADLHVTPSDHRASVKVAQAVTWFQLR